MTVSPDSRKHRRNLWQNGSPSGFEDSIRTDKTSEERPRQEWHPRPDENRAESETGPEWNFESFSSHLDSDHHCLEYCPICRFADLVRATATPELKSQLMAWQRESALMLRALLDYYIERLADNGPEERVEDIPIE